MKIRRYLQSARNRPLPLAFLVLAAAVRFYRIGAQSLWNDEGNSAVMASRSFVSIARNAAHDIHPPLYYWLLHLWSLLFGTSEAALRSLSALFGVLVVWLVFEITDRLMGRKEALAAMLVAAASPLAIYYSQEARMYAMLAAILALGAWVLVEEDFSPGRTATAAMALIVASGLYTHYTFPLAWAPIALVWLWYGIEGKSKKDVIGWAAAHAFALLLFLPWLPIALHQVVTWPRSNVHPSLSYRLATSWKWLVAGPMSPAGPMWLWALAALLIVAGAIRRYRHKAFVWLWFGVPFAAILLPGLYKPSYLKFLVAAIAPWAVMASAGIFPRGATPRKWPEEVMGGVVLLVLLVGFARLDYEYFTNPKFARDDYRGMARYIEAVGRPGDAIVLDAPGQIEVFRYYYKGKLPVYGLPLHRPPDEKATLAALDEIVKKHDRIFALYWATNESDPKGIVEKFLASHGFKSVDRWQGNVRFVVYSLPQKELKLETKKVQFGGILELEGYSLYPINLHAGEILQVLLRWKALSAPKRKYKVSVQVLDAQNQVVAQQDGEPAGGSKPTDTWHPGEVVDDLHGVLIPFGTPPGNYRVFVVVYDRESGRRLRSEQGDMVLLGQVSVERPAGPPPEEIIGFEHRADVTIHGARLIGFDVYRKGFSYAPDAPIHPGDVLHVTLYWKAIEPSGKDWEISLRLQRNGNVISRTEGFPAGPGFTPRFWKPSDVLKGEFDLRIPAEASAGTYRLEIAPADGSAKVIGKVKISRR